MAAPDVHDGEPDRAVEHRPRTRRPHGDLAPPLAPEQEEEEGDREEERDPGEQEEAEERRLQLEQPDPDGDQENDREAADCGVDPAHAVVNARIESAVARRVAPTNHARRRAGTGGA